jgi:putative ABC transport system permease protein
MNIMLVSVAERTREIGLRMAIGASGRDVRLQFLIEAVMLGLSGGVFGIAAGAISAQIMTVTLGWPMSISPTTIAVAVGFATAVGLVFGYVPASHAAQLDPIEALRSE